MNEAMRKLVDAIQKASPIVWQAAYRQVWIEGIEAFVVAIAFLVAGMAFLLWARTWRDSGDRAMGKGLGCFISLLSIPCGMFVLECLLNPTYQAIKNLKGLL